MKIKMSLFLFVMFVCNSLAKADLLITPTRVSFEPRDRTQYVTLINTDDKVRTYKLDWIEQKQTQTQGYSSLSSEELEEFNTASQYIRMSPRRVRLAPGESQRIKLLVRRKSDMDQAEYRSHLKFTALPPEEEEDSSSAQQASGISINIDVLTSYTIPVVVNNKALPYEVKFTKVEFIETPERKYPGKIKFSISKKTPISTFGNVIAYFKPSGSEKYKPVGYLNGLNIFHETDKIHTYLAWSEKETVQNGTIKVVYQGAENFKGRFEISQELDI